MRLPEDVLEGLRRVQTRTYDTLSFGDATQEAIKQTAGAVYRQAE